MVVKEMPSVRLSATAATWPLSVAIKRSGTRAGGWND